MYTKCDRCGAVINVMGRCIDGTLHPGRACEREPWRLVQDSTGRVIRTFASEEDAIFYQRHDSLYPVTEYTISGPESEASVHA